MSKDRAAQLVEAGIWLKLSGDREGARKLFERALKLDPENEKASQLLAGAPAPGEDAPPPPAPEGLPPPPISSSLTPPPGTNPFEPPLRTASPSDLDWGAAAGVNPVAPPAPEVSLDGDWGRMTGAATPIPQPPPPGSSPSSLDASRPSSSGSNVSLVPGGPAMPQSWGNSGSGVTAAPKQTMVAFAGSSLEQPPGLKPKQTMVAFVGSSGSGEAPAPRNTMVAFAGASALPVSAEPPRNTLVGWGAPAQPPSDVAPQVVSLSGEAPHESPPPSTPPLFSASAPVPLPAQVVSIGGDAPFEPPPPMTPPLFASLEPPAAAPAAQVVQIGGDPGPETPPPSTPPIFSAPASAAPPPPVGDALGFAWSWSASPPPAPTAPTFDFSPDVDPEPPAPRPSPSLAPKAESAWDARSNPGIKLEAVVGHDRALDLISSDSKSNHQAPSRGDEVKAILRGARDLLELDDHSGAMELIVKAQQMAPDDPDVQLMRERSEKTLLNMFESKLGKIETIPRVLLKDDEIIWLNLDHRAGFVLAQIDGTVSFDDLFSVSGMSRIDTARILAQLVEEGVISRG